MVGLKEAETIPASSKQEPRCEVEAPAAACCCSACLKVDAIGRFWRQHCGVGQISDAASMRVLVGEWEMGQPTDVVLTSAGPTTGWCCWPLCRTPSFSLNRTAAVSIPSNRITTAPTHLLSIKKKDCW